MYVRRCGSGNLKNSNYLLGVCICVFEQTPKCTLTLVQFAESSWQAQSWAHILPSKTFLHFCFVISCVFQRGISEFVTKPILKIKLAVMLAQVL